MIALLRQEWKVCVGTAAIALVAIIEPQWAFQTVRFVSAGIYAVLLAASS
jgi:hypothetical protein